MTFLKDWWYSQWPPTPDPQPPPPPGETELLVRGPALSDETDLLLSHPSLTLPVIPNGGPQDPPILTCHEEGVGVQPVLEVELDLPPGPTHGQVVLDWSQSTLSTNVINNSRGAPEYTVEINEDQGLMIFEFPVPTEPYAMFHWSLGFGDPMFELSVRMKRKS